MLSRWYFVVLPVLMLVGCAHQNTYRDGMKYLENNQYDQALAYLTKAVNENPSNIDYQYALRRAKEEMVKSLLDRAAVAEGQNSEVALELYRSVLLISPANSRALQQMKVLADAKTRERLLREAREAQLAGRDLEARAKYKRLLTENPGDTSIRKELLTLDEKEGRSHLTPSLDPSLLKPVTITFRDSTLRVVMEAMSVSNGVNFVLDKDIKEDMKVTVTFRNLPLDQALDQILQAQGLAKKVINQNSVAIYPNTQAKGKEYQDLIVRNFFVESADVKQLTNLLKNVLKIRDIHADEKRNLIVIRDTAQQVLAAEKIIAAHDQAEPEVVLDVEILELDHKLSNSLGLQFPNQVGFTLPSQLTLDALNNITKANIGVSGLSTALQINMQSQFGVTKVLANPSIRIRNREKAKFHVGDKVPVITTTTYPGTLTGATTSAVSYLDVGIKLEFEPVIMLDDQVMIKATMEDSAISNTVVNNGTTAYQVGTRNVATTLTLRDRETQVLAGLIRTDEQNSTNQLPGLGQVPIVGRLFQSPANTNSKKEILLSITPRIVRNLTRPSNELAEINTGPESNLMGASPSVVLPRSTSTPAPAVNSPLVPAPTPNTPGAAPGNVSAPAPGAPIAAGSAILNPMVPFGQSAPAPVFNASPAQAPSAAPAVAPVQAPAAVPLGANTPVFETPPGVGSPRN